MNHFATDPQELPRDGWASHATSEKVLAESDSAAAEPVSPTNNDLGDNPSNNAQLVKNSGSGSKAVANPKKRWLLAVEADEAAEDLEPTSATPALLDQQGNIDGNTR